MTRELKGWHVLAMTLGFFGITIAVNLALAIYAIDTFSGEDVAKPYLRGLAYNRTLEERAAQTALGWKATIEVTRESGNAAISAHVEDRDGQAKGSLTVEATLRRPTDARLDRTVDLGSAGGGDYKGVATELAPGAWDIIVRAKGSGAVFQAQRRVVLK